MPAGPSSRGGPLQQHTPMTGPGSSLSTSCTRSSGTSARSRCGSGSSTRTCSDASEVPPACSDSWGCPRDLSGPCRSTHPAGRDWYRLDEAVDSPLTAVESTYPLYSLHAVLASAGRLFLVLPGFLDEPKRARVIDQVRVSPIRASVPHVPPEFYPVAPASPLAEAVTCLQRAYLSSDLRFTIISWPRK